MSAKRIKGYKSLGYSVGMREGAVEGDERFK